MKSYRICCIESGLKGTAFCFQLSPGCFMQSGTSTIALRLELLGELDQQIEMLASKTFAAFSKDEVDVFRNREHRIRELEKLLAAIPAIEPSHIEAASMTLQ